MRVRPKSEAAYAQLCERIPGGVNSPIRALMGMEMPPMIVQKGEGSKITDIDGHSYVDFCGSFGPLIHGHCHPYILSKVEERLRCGTSFGITTLVEKELAEKICSLVPSVEMIRFVNSGTEAVMTALRMARGFTGRNLIVKFAGHYHGHSDALLVQAGSGLAGMGRKCSSLGIPDTFIQFTYNIPFNDFSVVEDLFKQKGDQIAALILEPVAANMGVILPAPGFLQFLREMTLQYGTLLIFDEVITGFRLGLQGAQGVFGIEPDLSCFGKIVGGGFPAAAVGGKREMMSVLAPLGGVYQAGTLSGNPIAMQAGIASLELIEQDPLFYQKLEEKTQLLVQPLRAACKELPIAIPSIGSLFSIHFGKKKVGSFEEVLACNRERFKKLFHFLFHRGVYPPPHFAESWFVSAAHTEQEILQTKDLCLAAIHDQG